MPIMGGMELLSIMHKSEKLNQIPVIVTTSQGAVNSEVQAMERGAADFITKPYNPTIVRCRVHNVMARMENEWRKMEQAAQDVQLREMRHNIEIDRLTGIYNHEAFLAKAASMIQENRDVRYSIAYFNISCFKVINELFNTSADYRQVNKSVKPHRVHKLNNHITHKAVHKSENQSRVRRSFL